MTYGGSFGSCVTCRYIIDGIVCNLCLKGHYKSSFLKASYDRCVSVPTDPWFPEQPTVASCSVVTYRAITYVLLFRRY